MGAVKLCRIVFVVIGQPRAPLLRWTVRAACLSVMFVIGFQRRWVGAHWPSDVIGGYALGGVLLAALLVLRDYFTRKAELPLLNDGRSSPLT